MRLPSLAAFVPACASARAATREDPRRRAAITARHVVMVNLPVAGLEPQGGGSFEPAAGMHEKLARRSEPARRANIKAD